MNKADFSKALSEVLVLLKTNVPPLLGLEKVCNILKKHFEHYHWVGFYFADFKKQTLNLKAFSGNPVELTEIPFGKGICGQVAISNENFVVPDVLAQDNYLSCSIDVRSEIVIPLFLKGKNIGQIDIDSKKIDPFTSKDTIFLETICALISKTYNTSLLHL